MLALDFALFVRDAAQQLNLSLATLGVAYTLAFRIGTNINTWVSQESLAKEMNVCERTVRRQCKILKKAKIILIKKDSNDKRNNLYSFNPLLYNYAQMDEKTRKKYRTKMSSIYVNRGQKCPVNTGQKCPIISDNKSLADPVIIGLPEIENLPKRKSKEKEKIKIKKKPVDKFEIPDWVDKVIWSNFEQHRRDMKSPLSNQAKKLCLAKLEKLKNEGYDVGEILNQSILNGWKGLFPLHNYSKPQNNVRYTQDSKQCNGCKRSQTYCQCHKPTRTTVSSELASSMSPEWRAENGFN